MESDFAISLTDLRKRYKKPNGEYETVLGGVSLQIRPGKIVGFFGRSGSGKTTLLRIVSGVLDWDSGQAHVFGNHARRHRGRVAYVSQQPGLLAWRTLWGNALLGWTIGKKRGKETRESVEVEARTLFEQLDLSTHMKKYPGACSGGQLQRTALIRALLTPSDILALDEPVSALDYITRQDVYDKLSSIVPRHGATSRTILLVSHDPEDLVFLCDEVVVLSLSRHTISAIIPVPFERPRPHSLRFEPAFSNLKHELWRALE